VYTWSPVHALRSTVVYGLKVVVCETYSTHCHPSIHDTRWYDAVPLDVNRAFDLWHPRLLTALTPAPPDRPHTRYRCTSEHPALWLLWLSRLPAQDAPSPLRGHGGGL